LTRPPRSVAARLFAARLFAVAGALATAIALAGLALPADAAEKKRHRRHRAAPAAAAAAAGAASPAPAARSFNPALRPEVREFVERLVAREGFDAKALERVFSQAELRPEVLKLIAPPPPTFKRSWHAYRARFLDPLRVREGVRFWREQRDALERASLTYGVPEEILVAIIGVETVYGRVTGEFRVVDALATLGFGYPPRAAFFLEELEQFLLFARENDVDPLSVRGSFAGAIGLPQFMPGSIRRYAVDFDGDGRIDLRASAVDAIGSVAKFLAGHGWVQGEPTHFDARIAPGARLEPLIAAGIEPQFTIAELEQSGVASATEVPPDTKLGLVDLPNGDAPPSYYLGARNFYAITRYNRSSFYAMAVIELARTVAASR